MGNPTEGVTTKLCFDTALPIDVSSIPVSFISDGLRSSQAKRAPQGITGSRSQKVERVRKDVQNISGDIVIPFSPVIFDFILPLALGGTEAADSFPLAETVASFFVMAERGGQTFEYEVYVNKMTLRGSSAGPVEMILNLLGKTELEDVSAFPALTEPTDAPYQIEDLVLQYAAATREILDFELSVDNVLAARFRNSITAQHIVATDRIVMLKTTNPWSADEEVHYRAALGGTAGLLTFTNGTVSATATLAAIEWKDDTPIVPGKVAEVPFVLEGQCFKTGSTLEVVFTNDPVV